jgi:hypothetical protein
MMSPFCGECLRLGGQAIGARCDSVGTAGGMTRAENGMTCYERGAGKSRQGMMEGQHEPCRR